MNLVKNKKTMYIINISCVLLYMEDKKTNKFINILCVTVIKSRCKTRKQSKLLIFHMLQWRCVNLLVDSLKRSHKTTNRCTGSHAILLHGIRWIADLYFWTHGIHHLFQNTYDSLFISEHMSLNASFRTDVL